MKSKLNGKQKRVELIYTDDPYTKLRSGERGTITDIRLDLFGETLVSVAWDSGSTLTLIRGKDRWKPVADEE